MNKTFFQNNGYLVVDKKTSGINIDLISNKIFKKLINLDFKEHNYIKKNSKSLSQLIDNINHLENNHSISSKIYKFIPTMVDMWSFSTQPKLIKLLKSLGIKSPTFSTVPCMRIDRPNENFFATPWHQDYWYSFISNESVTIWIPLLQIPKSMGRLIVLPKSHKFGLKKFNNAKNSNDPFVISDLPKKQLSNQKEVNVPYGSILIFNQCLLHKSGINKSNNCRISIQLRYNSFKKNDEILSSFEAKSTDHVINNQSHVLKN